jgi:hypothetical protein
MEKKKSIVNSRNKKSIDALKELYELNLKLLPHYGDSVWNKHSMVVHNVMTTARTLYLDQLYKKIVNVPGVICEFGVQWGTTLTQLINLRSIYEPFNHSRIVYGFDTFEGFPSVHEKDGVGYNVGDLATLDNYEEILNSILEAIEAFPPMSHLRKFELIKGNVIETIDQWLKDNPHAIISMAILDMDLYEPTKIVLEKIKHRFTKGTVIAFDELNCKTFPGETVALDEVLGLNNLRLQRSPLHTVGSWAVYGE